MQADACHADPTLLRQAVAALEAGRFARAARACRARLARAPEDTMALTVLGLALGGLGDAGAALVLHRLACLRPGDPHPAHAVAALLRQRGRNEAIGPIYAACLRLAPGDATIRAALAGHLAERVAALADAGAFDAAIREARALVALVPDAAGAWSNLGVLLKIRDRFEEAVAAADAAVALAARSGRIDPQIRLNRAVTLLRAGRMDEAWAEYEARLHLPGQGSSLPPERRLQALEGVAGLTVLLTHEEGYGDTLQFVRYAPLLAARGMRVLVWVPPPLAPLLRGMAGIAAVIPAGEAIPPFHAHCPMFSLPRVFATTLATIPAAIPYLRPDPARVASWGARLPDGDGLRVGLVWAGQARPWLPGFAALDARRSMRLADLAPLAAVPGARFVSLQMGPPAAQAATPPPGMALHDPMPAVADFADTAAIVAQLDVVVSVDTSVAHLAGALGRPVLLLDRYDGCWRWLSGRTDSPWYPTLHILRQPSPGDWAAVVARAVTMLRDRAARRAVGP